MLKNAATEPTQSENLKMPWYMSLPVLIILFFIFMPFSSIASIVLFFYRIKVTKNSPKKRRITIATLSTLIIIIVSFISMGIYFTVEGEKELNQINTAIDSGNYAQAQTLLDKARKDGDTYKLASAEARMYEKQGMYDEAAKALLDYGNNIENKKDISQSMVDRLNGLTAKCSPETTVKINDMLAQRTDAINAYNAEQEAKKQAKADAAAKKKAEKEAKKQAKADAAAKEKAEKEAQKQAKADATAKNTKSTAVATAAPTSKTAAAAISPTAQPTKAPRTEITADQAIKLVKKSITASGDTDGYGEFKAEKYGNHYNVFDGNVYDSAFRVSIYNGAVVRYECYNCSYLVGELNTNAMRAKDTFLNQYAGITGEFSSIDNDGKYFTIKENDNYINCMIENKSILNELANLNRGDWISVYGKISGVGEVLGISCNVEFIAQ